MTEQVQKRTSGEGLVVDRMITEYASGENLNDDIQSTEGDYWKDSE